MQSRKKSIGVVAFTTILGMFTSASAGASESPASPRVPVLNWVACGDDVPGRECATARVPLDYDQPYGATIPLALARIPASDSARKKGSVFLNPGGPGAPGLDLIFGDFGPFLEEQLQGRFDIVAFDPRGIGASEPIRCFNSNDAENAGRRLSGGCKASLSRGLSPTELNGGFGGFGGFCPLGTRKV